jgi:hypothetical protein
MKQCHDVTFIYPNNYKIILRLRKYHLLTPDFIIIHIRKSILKNSSGGKKCRSMLGAGDSHP